MIKTAKITTKSGQQVEVENATPQDLVTILTGLSRTSAAPQGVEVESVKGKYLRKRRARKGIHLERWSDAELHAIYSAVKAVGNTREYGAGNKMIALATKQLDATAPLHGRTTASISCKVGDFKRGLYGRGAPAGVRKFLARHAKEDTRGYTTSFLSPSRVPKEA